MAELFGLLASLTGLISTANKITAQLSHFIDSFRTAPRTAHSLASELQELCSVLDKLWRIFSGRQPREDDPLANLQNVLDNCSERLEELRKFAKAHVTQEGDRAVSRQLKRWTWSFQEKEVAALKGQLEAHKATLNITLLLCTRDTTSVKGTAALQDRIREVDNRLISDGEKAKSDAVYASSDILRRYLESCSRSAVFSLRSSSPIYQKRISTPLLPRVAEDEIQSPNRSKSVPPPPLAATTLAADNIGSGNDIIRSSSAMSMRPARYVSGRNLHRRHSDISPKPRPENSKRNSDPQLQFRNSNGNRNNNNSNSSSSSTSSIGGYQNGEGGGGSAKRMGSQRVVKDARPTTGQIWADMRSLVNQNLPHEVMSEQFLQAQSRLEQSRGKTNGGGVGGRRDSRNNNPDRIEQLAAPPPPARRDTVERKITKSPQLQKKPSAVKKTAAAEPKGKAKDVKAVIKVEVKETAAPAPAPRPEAKRKSTKEKVRLKAAAQKAALDEQSAAERARLAAKYRGLILPGAPQPDRGLNKSIVSEIKVVNEKPKQASDDGPRPDKTRPLSTGNGWSPANTKISKSHVCKEVLDESQIHYTEELEYFVIHQNVSLTDQINLRVRTNEIQGV